jgi:hypothetical protein
MNALRDQELVNQKLRSYIDNVLTRYQSFRSSVISMPMRKIGIQKALCITKESNNHLFKGNRISSGNTREALVCRSTLNYDGTIFNSC